MAAGDANTFEDILQNVISNGIPLLAGLVLDAIAAVDCLSGIGIGEVKAAVTDIRPRVSVADRTIAILRVALVLGVIVGTVAVCIDELKKKKTEGERQNGSTRGKHVGK